GLPAADQADGADSIMLANEGGPDFAFSPITIGTLPSGKSVTIKFDVTVNGPPIAAGVNSVSAQGTVSGSNFSNVLTDDPDVVGTANPTVTTINAAPDLQMVSVS